MKKLRDLFESDVTRDIPPVVYFHEQSPQKLADEVSEYIITGGYPSDHPHHKRVPRGIHEEYVRLLGAIADELEKAGGPELPASWISGFYGSGKSSFAKLLGLALDGIALPDGSSLAAVLLERDRSPNRHQLSDAYKRLRARIEPLAVVFDIGGVARDNEHIHTAAVRQIQKRLGYCPEPHAAEMELRLERDGRYDEFLTTAERILGRAWDEVKSDAMAEEDFSLVMSELMPEHYPDPTAWYASRAGTYSYAASVEESTRAIADMLARRAPDRTLFAVIDEVSQYVHQDTGRMLKLQSFVSDLGQRLKGKVWLLVTGQEQLEHAAETGLGKLKDRFPQKLRVHLSNTNIRDVVHKRLLSKTPEAVARLRTLFAQHRNDLKLFAYQCEDITEEDFIDVYPLLPEHIDLILQITSALRIRSHRAQGDDQAVRGLLQLLGELFRSQDLADMDIGTLVTLDQVYEVQHTALDTDVQASMARIAHYLGKRDPSADASADAPDTQLLSRVARCVALLELIQDKQPTTAKLCAACLYDRLDRGPNEPSVTAALEELRRHNLLGYSEKRGYKIQSTAGEEWERERRDIPVSSEQKSELVQAAIKQLASDPEKVRLDGRPFPWRVLFSDGRRADDVHLIDTRDSACVVLDIRYLPTGERTSATWVDTSAKHLPDRLVWVSGDIDELDDLLRQYGKSVAMIRRYESRKQSLAHDRQRLLLEEHVRAEHLHKDVARAVASTWLDGRIYFRGNAYEPRDFGASFGAALSTATGRILRELYPHFVPVRVTAAEMAQLLAPQLSGPSAKFLDDLGLLSLEAGRYVSSCHGVIPTRIMEFIQRERGASGAGLLQHFGGPPYGYPDDVVQACVAGLLRGNKVKIQPEGGAELSAMRDVGARDLFTKSRTFSRATVYPAGDDAIGRKVRARICKFFQRHMGVDVDRENDPIADAVSGHFPAQSERLRAVFRYLDKLPGDPRNPEILHRLDDALTRCYGQVRRTEPTVRALVRHLDTLNDGLERLGVYSAELTDAAIAAVRDVDVVLHYQHNQLMAYGALNAELAEAGRAIHDHLASEHPWRAIDTLEPALAGLRQAYLDERRALLDHQALALEAARARIKTRDGFALLTADQSNHVLRPIAEVQVDENAEAVAPTLEQLRDRFERQLAEAENEANERLDAIPRTGTGTGPDENKPRPMPVRKVAIGLDNREIADERDLERALDDLRQRVLVQLRAGVRVRLVNRAGDARRSSNK